jgi:hypothetical protein
MVETQPSQTEKCLKSFGTQAPTGSSSSLSISAKGDGLKTGKQCENDEPHRPHGVQDPASSSNPSAAHVQSRLDSVGMMQHVATVSVQALSHDNTVQSADVMAQQAIEDAIQPYRSPVPSESHGYLASQDNQHKKQRLDDLEVMHHTDTALLANVNNAISPYNGPPQMPGGS